MSLRELSLCWINLLHINTISTPTSQPSILSFQCLHGRLFKGFPKKGHERKKKTPFSSHLFTLCDMSKSQSGSPIARGRAFEAQRSQLVLMKLHICGIKASVWVDGNSLGMCLLFLLLVVLLIVLVNNILQTQLGEQKSSEGFFAGHTHAYTNAHTHHIT